MSEIDLQRQIDELKARMNQLAPLGVPNLSQLANSEDILIGPAVISPSATATSAIPTETEFTGAAMGGNGWTFNGVVWHFVAVALGELQAGISAAGKLLAGAGAWIADALGINITGMDFVERHTATNNSENRRMRRGFQDYINIVGGSHSLAYGIEYEDSDAGSNLVTTNPSIESGNVTSGFSANTGWSASTDYARTGSYSAKTTGTSALTISKYATTPGTRYRISLAFLGDYGDTVTIQAKYYTAAPALVATETIYSGSAYAKSWANKSITTSPAATSTQTEITVSKTGSGTLYVDDFVIEVASEYAAIRLSDDGVAFVDEAYDAFRFYRERLYMPIVDTASSSYVHLAQGTAQPTRAILGSHKMDGLPDWNRPRPIEEDFCHYANGLTLDGGISFNAIGTGSLSALGEDGHDGIVRISQNGANTGATIYIPTDFMVFGEIRYFDVIFRIPTTTNVVARIGMQDSFNTAAPTDAMYFHVAGTTLDGRNYSNTATATTATSYTITGNTWYRGRITTANSGLGTGSNFYIFNADGDTLLWSAALSTNAPDNTRNSSIAAVAYKTTAGSNDILDVDYMAFYGVTR